MTYIEEDIELEIAETLMVLSSLTTLALSIILTTYHLGVFA